MGVWIHKRLQIKVPCISPGLPPSLVAYVDIVKGGNRQSGTTIVCSMLRSTESNDPAGQTDGHALAVGFVDREHAYSNAERVQLRCPHLHDLCRLS